MEWKWFALSREYPLMRCDYMTKDHRLRYCVRCQLLGMRQMAMKRPFQEAIAYDDWDDGA
jgi:hypothetical protein